MAHQTDALKRLKNGAVLTGGVGTGKTLTVILKSVQTAFMDV